MEPSVVERATRTMRYLSEKPVFEKGNASWITEIPSVFDQ